VFQSLLKMCPGLEARLLASSDEEAKIIADLVSWCCIFLDKLMYGYFRFKREQMLHVPMIPRA